jgi:very-short-patch-repair endonuclease
MKRRIIPYNSELKERARQLRLNSTKSEILLWLELNGNKINGFDFHRQKPLLDYIVDFYCAELNLVIELDGYSHNHNEVVKKDAFKEQRLKEFGLTTLRFSDNEVIEDMDNVLRVINGFIESFLKEQ